MPIQSLSPLEEVNVAIASEARICNYYLGGKDNFAADRLVGDAVMASAPDMPRLMHDNHDFTLRAAGFMADEGVRQILDLGSGLPIGKSLHEVAQRPGTVTRVAYLDRNPMVTSHRRALSAADGRTVAVTYDLRHPGQVRRLPALCEHFDWSEPIAVFLTAVLHHCPGDVARLVAAYREHLPPGSWLVLSHLAADESPDEVVAEVRAAYEKGRVPLIPRRRAEIEELFDGFDLVEPGCVDVARWRWPLARPTTLRIWGGVGRC